MSFYSQPLVAWTEKGLYCEAGNFYVDPHRVVENAIVTHAHSDHARRGSKHYRCEKSGIGVLKSRLGKNIVVTGHAYGEVFDMNGVKVSFHSAGHILGSAQVRIEHNGEVWVCSGDYKRDPDPSCEPFEIVKCDTFITEATFGTPKYVWDKGLEHGRMIQEWWDECERDGRNCVLFGYSLGKAQRILAELAPYAKKPVLIYHTISEITECYRAEGRKLAQTTDLKTALDSLARRETLQGELILAPPSVLNESWAHQLGNYETAFASGWMAQSGGTQGGRSWGHSGYDRGFVMSDHADWNDLNRTIDESGAKRVFVQHRDGALVRHLRKKGIDAHPVEALVYENYVKLGGETLSLFENLAGVNR